MAKLVPTWYCPKLTEVSLKRLHDLGYTTILCDLDNTLAPFYAKTPTQEAKKFVEEARMLGMNFYVISNNHPERVELFCQPLEVTFLCETRKPLKGRLAKFISMQKIDITKTILIGDQLLTDVWLAKRINCDSLLVEPAVEKDLVVTKINRFIDKRMRRKLIKKGLLKGVNAGNE